MTKFLRISLLGALVACLLNGQTDSGRIVGTVTDSTGSVVPKATITVVDEKNGKQRTVEADNAGFYAAPNLSPSTYKVTAKGNNLGPTDYTGIPISVGQERTLNIVVRPATMTTEVTV